MRRIAVLNLKGGSSKTTTALSLAVGMALLQEKKKPPKRILLVDADPSANASFTILDGRGAPAPTLAHVLLGDAEPSEAIRPTRIPLLNVLPAAGILGTAIPQLELTMGKEQRLSSALRKVEDDYDACIVDSPPSLSLLTTNVLRAVTDVVVPCDSSIYSVSGLSRLQETIIEVRKFLDHDPLHIIGMVLTKVVTGNPAAKTTEKKLRELFGQLVFRTVVPYDPAVENALNSHRSVLEFAPQSEAAKAYNKLIMEILNHGKQNARPTRPVHGRTEPTQRGKKRRAG